MSSFINISAGKLPSKVKGNSRWFYFWYKATPDKILDDLAEYGKTTKQEILERGLDEDGLNGYAEEVGLIKNNNDFDRSKLNDAVAIVVAKKII